MKWEYLRVGQRIFGKRANLEEIKTLINQTYPKSVVNIQADGGMSSDAQEYGAKGLLYDLMGGIGWEMVTADHGQLLFKRQTRE